MKKLEIFILATLLSMMPIAVFSAELTDQVISDVYVDDAGNLAFGIKVMGMPRVPNRLLSPTADQLDNLCVWNMGGNKINDLRFRYAGTGAEKQAALSTLLYARMKSHPVTVTYTPLDACEDTDSTRCACEDNLVTNLAGASAVVLQTP